MGQVLIWLFLYLAGKKVLIVYAHQSAGSFNAAAKDAAKEALTAQGCTVEVSDLYAMKFKATATAEDIIGTYLTCITKSCFWLLFSLAWNLFIYFFSL